MEDKMKSILLDDVIMDIEDKKKSILSDDVIMDILLLLPIKSLMRFKCVNKTWLQLLTNDPQFVQLYKYQLNKNPIMLAIRFEKSQDDHEAYFYSAAQLAACDEAVDLEFQFRRVTGTISNSYNSYEVHGILNGLLWVNLTYENKKSLFLWNPLTNDYIQIPSPPILTHSFKSCDKKITSFGFGFLQATNQYKAICFRECGFGNFRDHSHVDVYTLGTDLSWRNLKNIKYHSFYKECDAPLVNGALHWIAETNTIFSFPESMRIVSFNMKSEGFQELQHPFNLNLNLNYDAISFNTLGVLGGLLSILGRDLRQNVQVWVMLKYGVASSWTKQFTIEAHEVCGSFTCLQPMAVAHNGKILLRKSAPKVAGELILYNLETQSVTNSKECGFNLLCACTYTPSLVSPRAIAGGNRYSRQVY